MKTKVTTFKQARKIARRLKLNSRTEWRNMVKSGKAPANIPNHPDSYYSRNEQWTNWADFLGKEEKLVSYETAKRILKKMKIKTHGEFRKMNDAGSRPNNIPYHPDRVYSEFTTWAEFLG